MRLLKDTGQESLNSTTMTGVVRNEINHVTYHSMVEFCISVRKKNCEEKRQESG